MEMNPFFQVIDPGLIWFYRLTGHAGIDFVIGTMVLAFITLVIGQFTCFLISLILRKRIDESTAEAEKYKNLSIDALKAGNKEAYKAVNKLGNEAFGKSFFMQFTLGAGFLWSIFFALAWMQYRFLNLEFPIPFTSSSLGYIGIFILLYIPVYVLFKKAKRNLPDICRMAILTRGNPQDGTSGTLAELIEGRTIKTAMPGDGARENG